MSKDTVGVTVLGSMERLHHSVGCQWEIRQEREVGPVVEGLKGPASRTHLKSSCHLKQSSGMTRSGV